MKNKLPEIRIKDAWLLRMNVSQHLHELWAKEGAKLADDKKMEKIVESYQEAWQPKEKEILNAITELYDLTYRQNIIDVYIAPWFNAFSDPLVFGVMNKPDEFVDTLTHELLHRLFVDNTSLPYKNNILLKEWQELFGENFDFSTLVHIPVHAGMKYIYLDVLKEPAKLERDMKQSKGKEWGKPYADAWNYVDENGYKEINKMLRESYLKLATQSSAV